MKKLNFERKLIAWYEKNKGRKFVWGEFDCALSVLEALEIVYGEKLIPPVKWQSKKEALEIYACLQSPLQLFLNVGFKVAKTIQTGDVVILKTETMHTLCIAINNKYTVIDEIEGLQLRKISDIVIDYTILRRDKLCLQ